MSALRILGKSSKLGIPVALAAVVVAGLCLVSCNNTKPVNATSTPSTGELASVAVVKAGRKTLNQQMSISSELVPFQEIDVYAKESGYVTTLDVDYGSRVKKDQVMAVLEIPELEQTLEADKAAIKAAKDQAQRLAKQVESVEARRKVLHDYYNRLAEVAKSQKGLIAQQEVDDAQGKDLTAQADVDAARANQQAAESQAEAADAKLKRDQVLYGYRKITAPFAGVVTQRFANYGTLLQAGTNSSTQAMPLVRLSQDDKFRLVIPVPEAYVKYIHVGDPVKVTVPSLNQTFPGAVARFSVDVKEDTRTMHTEVDVPNPNNTLYPGLYADASIRLQQKSGTLAVPLAALDRQGDRTSVDVVGPSNEVEVRPVTTGIETADDVEILSGLTEGEMVVIGDRSGLKSGQRVSPKPVKVTEYKETQ